MKRLLSLFLCLMTAMMSFAQIFVVGDLYYKISSSSKPYTIEVTSGYPIGSYTGAVTIPSSVHYDGKTYSVTRIGDYAFSWCDGLTSVTIGNNVTAIGYQAFAYSSGLTSVDIPNSVMTIGKEAFSCCSSLTSVNIPSSVKSLGESAFYGCSSLASVNIPSSVTTINKCTFSGCSGLTSITVPNSVTSIGEQALAGCSGLTFVNIPSRVNTINNGTFSGCSSLTSINIPNSVKTIGGNAFSGCSGLTSITIPNSVTSIDYLAFYDCTGLTEIVSLASIPPVCNAGVFGNVDKSLCTLKVPKGSKDAYSQADLWKEFVNIEEVDVTGIEAVAAESVGNAEITAIYDLNGCRRDALQPGVNIVKMSDGTTRKVIKR